MRAVQGGGLGRGIAFFLSDLSLILLKNLNLSLHLSKNKNKVHGVSNYKKIFIYRGFANQDV